jgi:hypothetical protein
MPRSVEIELRVRPNNDDTVSLVRAAFASDVSLDLLGKVRSPDLPLIFGAVGSATSVIGNLIALAALIRSRQPPQPQVVVIIAGEDGTSINLGSRSPKEIEDFVNRHEDGEEGDVA